MIVFERCAQSCVETSMEPDDDKDYIWRLRHRLPDDHPRHYRNGAVDLQIDAVRSERLAFGHENVSYDALSKVGSEMSLSNYY